MPATNCKIHGARVAVPLCEHLADSVDGREQAAAYLQYHGGDGVALCEACVRRRDVPEPLDAAYCLVCCACLHEWEIVVGNDFARRCRSAKSEYPTGCSPTDFVAPTDAVRIGGATFVFEDGWRVATRTGTWPFAVHPIGFWAVLSEPWPDVEELVRHSTAAPFPFALVVNSALAGSNPYWMDRAFGHIVAGFPVSGETREAALRAVERFPERTRLSVRAALGA